MRCINKKRRDQFEHINKLRVRVFVYMFEMASISLCSADRHTEHAQFTIQQQQQNIDRVVFTCAVIHTEVCSLD